MDQTAAGILIHIHCAHVARVHRQRTIAMHPRRCLTVVSISRCRMTPFHLGTGVINFYKYFACKTRSVE